MQTLLGHIARCMIAGVIAILPIGGTILGVAWIETSIADSGLIDSRYYFPGVGILSGALCVYLIGLLVTTFLGRWLWRIFDRLLRNLPGIGRIYDTFKQILGYGEGEDAIFREVVMLKSPYADGFELGLVTNRDGERLAVFLPGSPNPVDGRLVVVEAAHARKVEMPVSDALKTLVSVGATRVPQG